MAIDLQILSFVAPEEWEAWLQKNHTQNDGVWIKFAKKDSSITLVTHAQVLPIALCYGWIDGQARTIDDKYWLLKFTPRRPRSIWSKRNCEIVTQLIKDGRMQPAGLAQIEAAKADGRWDAAYDSVKNMVVPEDFLKELSKDPKALALFESLNRSNKYAITWKLQTAKKPETRAKRMEVFLAMLKKGEKLY